MASPEEMTRSMIANMQDKTGKTLEQWLLIAKDAGHSKHGAIVNDLKQRYGIGHGYAGLIAHSLLKSDAVNLSASVDLVAAQYAGPKAELRSIYDALIATAKAAGDIEIAPKKAYVSLRRKKQFAIIQASTKTRVDLGLCSKTLPFTKRLEQAGSFNAMVSHRVRLSSATEVDPEVKEWLRQAWSEAGE